MALEDQQTLKLIQTRMSEAVFDAAALRPLLADITEFLGASACQLITTDAQSQIIQSAWSRDIPPVVMEKEQEFIALNPRMQAIPMMRPLKPLRERDFITPDAIRTDPVYQEMILPAGMGHFSGAPVVQSATFFAGLAMFRHQEDDAFSDDETALQGLVMGAMAPAFSLVERLETEQVKTVAQLLSKSGAVIVIDVLGRVVERSAGVEPLLERGGLKIGPDRQLRFAVPGDANAYNAARGVGGLVGGRFLVHGPEGDLQAVAEIAPIVMFGVSGGLTGSAVITFRLVQAEGRLDQSLARTAFGLTPAEAEVAAGIARGLSIKTISEARGTTENTVRTVVKRVMAKVGVSRQPELVTALSSMVFRD